MKTGTPLHNFSPFIACENKVHFVVADVRKADAGIKKLKADMEREMCAFIRARYRRYVRFSVKHVDPPGQCVAGWEYNPR